MKTTTSPPVTPHAPGTWKPSPFFPAAVDIFSGDEMIASVHAGGRHPETVKARARLIAAAPDLLAACEMADDWITRHLGLASSREAVALRIVLKDAIARAAILAATTPKGA